MLADRAGLNFNRIREITKDAFIDLNATSGKFNYALWTVTSVFWKISGPLRDSLNKTPKLRNSIKLTKASQNKRIELKKNVAH